MLRHAVVIGCLLVVNLMSAITSAHATCLNGETEIRDLLGKSAQAEESCLNLTLPVTQKTLNKPVLVLAGKSGCNHPVQNCEPECAPGKIGQGRPLIAEINGDEERDGITCNCTPGTKECDKTCGDWPGLKRDTLHIFFYQAVSVGILYLLPEDISNWTKDQKHWGFGKWLKRIPKVHWDHDSWLFDYVQHPYWGAGSYVRARERGYDHWDSFLYSAAMSTVYEFIIEGQFERPSIQDLVATPVIGSLAGYYFMNVRQGIKAKETRQWYDEVVMVVTDPFGSLNSVVDRVLGLREQTTKCSLLTPGHLIPQTKNKGLSDGMAGSHVHSESVMGMQISLDW